MAYVSIMSNFTSSIQLLQNARDFVASVYATRLGNLTDGPSTSTSSSHCQTLEAFAEALDIYVRGVEAWCAEKETEIVHAQRGLTASPVVVSLLSFERSLQSRMSTTLVVLQDALKIFEPSLDEPRLPSVEQLRTLQPSVLSKQLLNCLLSATTSQLSIGETATAESLMDIFVHTAEPLWKKIGKWLKDGMHAVASGDDLDDALVDLVDNELFIERNSGVPLVSPDFWEKGYTLRTADDDEESSLVKAGESLVPTIFKDIAEDVLAAGKAVGLLRAMGLTNAVPEKHSSLHESFEWPSFQELYRETRKTAASAPEPGDPLEFSFSSYSDSSSELRLTIQALSSSSLVEQIASASVLTHLKLNRVLLDECGLQHHLSGLEDLCLMRRGDILGDYCRVIFAKVGRCRPTLYIRANTSSKDGCSSSMGGFSFPQQLSCRCRGALR